MSARVSEAGQSELIATVVEALQMLGDVATGNNVRELGKAISEIDRELSDVYHYIEFNDLNIVGGYRAYKMLQSILRRRRLAKDEYAIAQSVHDNWKSLNRIQSCLERNRIYTPRVLTELFVTQEVTE